MKTIVMTLCLLFLSRCSFGQDKAAIADAEAGCGPDNIKLSVTTDESKHPTPAPENGKALILTLTGKVGPGTQVSGNPLAARTLFAQFRQSAFRI
jgi:hypothetical protein